MTDWSTEQEAFWAGAFGDAYTDRNLGPEALANRVALFAKVLDHAADAETFLELGAGAGLNVRAIRVLRPAARITAVEINDAAVEHLKRLGPDVETVHQSILTFEPRQQYDLTLTRGVLIHIAPEQLPAVYDTLYAASCRYVCVIEYYNPAPVEVPYRGQGGKLFKRDFAGDMLERFPDLELLGYGFVYRRDPWPQDDVTWFVMRKRDPHRPGVPAQHP